MNRIVHFTLVLVTLVLTACGNQSPPYETVAPAVITAGSAVPPPTEEVILTLSGAIAVKNVGDTLAFDMFTLEKLGLVKYTVNDPWFNAQVTYTGILMSDLLRVAGVSASATTLHIIALDDYQVDIAIDDVQKWPILLATRADDEYMTVENAGPTRIIFPYDTYPDIDQSAYRGLWIWNIERMEVK